MLFEEPKIIEIQPSVMLVKGHNEVDERQNIKDGKDKNKIVVGPVNYVNNQILNQYESPSV